MQSPPVRPIFILLGAAIISILLGSGMINNQLQAMPAPDSLNRGPAPTTQPAMLVSLTPSDTPTRLPDYPSTSLPSTQLRAGGASPTTQLPDYSTTRLPDYPTTGPQPLTRTPTPTPTAMDTPWPTPDAKALTREVKVPILMYHHIGFLPADPTPLRTGLTVLPDNFENQLKFLKEYGYQGIDLYQMYYAITLGRELPQKPIVFTFDDAYTDVHQLAFPLMQKYGYTGTIFVPTDFIDQQRADYMSWTQLMELYQAGWRLEPHTKEHVQVDGQSRDYLIYQIYGSMETLRYHLGYQPRFFAYPSGAYDDQAIEMLKEIGYWGAVTTQGGWYHRLSNAYTWGRVRVAGQLTMKDFANNMGELDEGR